MGGWRPPTEMEIARKISLRDIDLSRPRHYHIHQSQYPNFIGEDIIMSLRKVAGAIALLALFSLMGGGGNHAASPVCPLGLFRLASLCP